MLIVGLVLAGLAAVLHGYLFYLESLAWTSQEANRVFRTTPQLAEQLRVLAYNHGFTHLMLTVVVTLGAISYAIGAPTVGLTLLLTGTACMVAAAAALWTSAVRLRQTAVRQGALPLLALAALATHVVF